MTVAEKPAKKKKQKDPAKKELERRIARAEAAKAEIELEKARISLELDQLRAHDARHSYALKANGDSLHGIFNLERSVGSSAPDLAAEVRQFCRTYEGAPVTLNIFSPGGSVFHGLVLYDTLRTVAEQGHPVTTVARGMAASMGSLLFLAGDSRLIGAEAQVMFHSLAAGTGGMLYEMEEDLEFYRRLNKQLYGIVTKRTKITAKLLAEKTRKKDWWLDAKQSIKLGVATGLG